MIERLDHVNLRTERLAEMVAWYCDVLGLVNGPRPDFPFDGAWLYAGEVAVVHLVQAENADSVGSEAALKLEHFAFTASGAKAFQERLEARGQTYRRSEIAHTGVVAYNVWDPDGNHIHVDFSDE